MAYIPSQNPSLLPTFDSAASRRYYKQYGYDPSKRYGGDNWKSKWNGSANSFGGFERTGSTTDANYGKNAGPTETGGGLFDLFGGLFDPALGSNLQGIFSPQFNFSMKDGLSGWGHNLGQPITLLNAGYQGLQAFDEMSNLSDINQSSEDIVSDILASSSSPYLQYDLSADQLDLLNKLRREGYDGGFDLEDFDLMDLLKGAGSGALTGIAGGMPGIITGAIGGGINSALDSASQAAQADNAELMALYNAVMQSEQQYKNMLRQRAYSTF